MPTSPRSESALAAYEAVVACGLDPRWAERVAAMRAAFEGRAGSFGPDDPWFEARSRAFWDDAVTSQGFAELVMDGLAPEYRPWARAFGRAHRGLFRPVLDPADPGGPLLLEDLWSGAELLVTEADPGMRTALATTPSLVDGRVAGCDDPVHVVLLPGAIFHPPEATDCVDVVLLAARATSVDTGPLLDSLLRMERQFLSLSRMKASFAYRADALSRKGVKADGE